MSIPKVKIAVLKNLLIFDEKYLPQSVRLLEGGGVETLFGRIPFEHRSFLYGSSLRRVYILGTIIDIVERKWTCTSFEEDDVRRVDIVHGVSPPSRGLK